MTFISDMLYSSGTEKSFLHLVKLNRIWIVITIFRLIWQQNWISFGVKSVDLLIWTQSTFHLMLIKFKTQDFNFCYQNLKLIYLMIWKLCGFRQRSHFGNFQKFFLSQISTEKKISNSDCFIGKTYFRSIRFNIIFIFFKLYQ